jgi:4'-phosphopantetheinyl transferase
VSGRSLPPHRVSLSSGEVHVWRAPLDVAAGEICEFEQFLASEERARAARFHFERDRDRFVAARGTLRRLLGRYVGCPPAALRFSYNGSGKPLLEAETGGMDVRFNLSHSHDQAVYAITREREVGIDVEWIERGSTMDGIAELYFSPREVTALRGLPPARRIEAFFRCWVQKEAFIKATGEGLQISLQSFDVPVAASSVPTVLHRDGREWSVQLIDPDVQGYVAAVAALGTDWTLRGPLVAGV